MRARVLTLFLALPIVSVAGSKSADVSSNKRVVDQGNHAWITGMQTGDSDMVAAIFAEDALSCGRSGDCTRGRTAILAGVQKRIASMGNASAAAVDSRGNVREGDFIFEWGSSKLQYADGRHSEGRYLTVWQLQENGEWKIFRNLSIPDDRHQ
jgi:ketosteroid isomerase-like protein